MKNYTQKFIGLLALVFAMSFGTKAQEYSCQPPICGVHCESTGGWSLQIAFMSSPFSQYNFSDESYIVLINSEGNVVGQADNINSENFSVFVREPHGSGTLIIKVVDANTIYTFNESINGAPNYPLGWIMNFGPFTVSDVCSIESSGCTNPNAENYNSLAVVDDGSCDIFGCTEVESINYDTEANINNGSCIPFFYGCTNPEYIEYNSEANTDDGSCVELISYGCTDPNAFNYDPYAEFDNGSCIIYGCMDQSFLEYWSYDEATFSIFEPELFVNTDDGSCENLIIEGCTNENYFEYNLEANVNNGSCTELIVYGCTDQTAYNYNPEANTDYAACIPIVYGCTDEQYLDYNSDANTDNGTCLTLIVEGCTDPNSSNYIPEANIDNISCIPFVDGSCEDDFPSCGVHCESTGGWSLQIAFMSSPFSQYNFSDESYIVLINSEGNVVGQADNINSENFSVFVREPHGSGTLIIKVVDANTIYTFNESINGAPNYPLGWIMNFGPFTVSDVCSIALVGCTNSIAENYNPIAEIDDGSCIVYGCTDPSAYNYFSLANIDDGSCIPMVFGCTNENYFEYNAQANTDDGSCFELIIEGCTDSSASNYNSEANLEIYSCIPFIFGCMNSLATNYNPYANFDDGSCQGIPCVDSLDIPIHLPQGWSMIGFTCIEPINVIEAFAEISGIIEIVKDEWGLAYLPAWGFSAFDNLEFGEGYQIKMVEQVNDFQFCKTYSIIDTCGNFYFEDDFILLPQGWSMFGYTCLESLDVVEAFSDISNNIEIVKDEWGLAYLPAWGFSAFDDLEFGEGYQIKMIEQVIGFQFCETIIGTE